MISQFVTRGQNDGKYCVWDSKTGAIAQAVNSPIRYENLAFGQAIDAAIELNGPARATASPSASDQKPSKKL
jgi:hypothetical protein